MPDFLREVYRRTQLPVTYATETSSHWMVAPAGSTVVPSSRRGPLYCPTSTTSPLLRVTVARFGSTSNPSVFEKTAAVSTWPTTEVWSTSTHFWASSSGIALTSTEAGISASMLSENAFARYMDMAIPAF